MKTAIVALSVGFILLVFMVVGFKQQPTADPNSPFVSSLGTRPDDCDPTPQSYARATVMAKGAQPAQNQAAATDAIVLMLRDLCRERRR